ncbi:hypothetical protein EYZ11_004826 [Aspergillus tanneri]|uniref:Uncharacterized protein n=1 Tax=Aspergillus tanneri TaxID=1220188 RepID=A0A4V3UPM1_9EURO|nr:hypothetical protein EYZ11_004826 [Aspergillus tanneri]
MSRRAGVMCRDKHPDVQNRSQNIFIALESFYSMDGDTCHIMDSHKLEKEFIVTYGKA